MDESSAPARRYRELGLVCHFAARSPRHGAIGLSALVLSIENAQQLGQVKVYLNNCGECVGYVAWAYLSPSTEREFIGGKVRPLPIHELSDGTSPWIIDFALAPGSLRYVMEDLRDNVFAGEGQLTYYRVKGGKVICKRVTRSDRTTFMAGGKTTLTSVGEAA